MYYHYKKWGILSFFLLFYVFQPKTVRAEERAEPSWEVLETTYTLIHYQSPNDLEKFNGRIAFGPGDWGLKRLFSTSEPQDLPDVVLTKVDLLYERVQEILEMQKKMDKVHIHIYPDKEQLHKAFFEIYQKPCRIRAWYRYNNNTIYTNVQDLHEGMLAHELAHAIIDHYLLVRPPRATAEILARYVDSHLR
jgi:hypothetical protein